MKLSNALQEYLNHLAERNLSPLHCRTVQSRLRQFIQPIAHRPIASVTALELHQHFQQLEDGRSDGTMAGYAGTHRAFWAWAVAQNHRPASPAERLKRYDYRPRKRRAAPSESVAKIANALPGYVAAKGYAARDVRDALAVSLSLDSGARIGEIRSLRRRDVEMALLSPETTANGRSRYTVVGHGKTGDQNITFFNETAELYKLWQLVNPHPKADFVFISLKTGKLITRETMGRCFLGICQYAGIPPIRSHAIRKRNASDIQQAMRDPELTRQYLGHTNISTTMKHYNDVDADRVGNAAAELASARRGDPLDLLFCPRRS